METIDFKKYFEYRDGELFWKVKTGHRIKVGDICNNKNIKTGYKRVGLYGKRYDNHRVIWEMFNGKIPDGLQIDHINSKKDDNRISNLQLVTAKQNQQRKNSSKGYIFRNRYEKNPYYSYKTYNGTQYYIGAFKTPCGAYMANRMFFVRGLHEQ
jgi:hypothetical protein